MEREREREGEMERGRMCKYVDGRGGTEGKFQTTVLLNT